MTPCAKGCCFTGLQVCGRQRKCACHALDQPRTEPRGSDAQPYRDPTSREAIRNIEQQRKKRKR